MRFAQICLGAWILCLLQAGLIRAQSPNADLPETKVVLRISREFIRELMIKQFSRDVPVDLDFDGTHVTGTAHAEGATDVQFKVSDNACAFDLIVNGQVTTQLAANRRSIQANIHGNAPFKASRCIVFDDIAFSAHKIDVDMTYHSNLDHVCSSRIGLAGVLARGIAQSKIERSLPQDDIRAEAEIRKQLVAAIEKESDELLVTLNKIGSIVKQGEDVLREEKLLSSRSVEHYLGATERSLFISVGPPNHRIARLPKLKASERQPIELWVAVKKKGKPDRLGPILQNWKLVKPFLLPRIAKQSAEAAKFLDQVQIKMVDDWHVLTFAPGLLESLQGQKLESAGIGSDLAGDKMVGRLP
ncbi:hypothetical protein BH10PLA2_BH10PLA2_14620 [soil metagenome]